MDFTKVFAPMARLETIRLVVALECERNWQLFQLDVKLAFLHGSLEEEVYVQQPPGFNERDKKQMVYRLHKALYGFKQTP